MAKKYPTFLKGEFRKMTSYDNYNHVYGINYIILDEGGPDKEKQTKAWVYVQRCRDSSWVSDGTLPYWTYKRFFGEKGRVDYALDVLEDSGEDLL